MTTTKAVTGSETAQNNRWLYSVSLMSVVFIPMKLDTNDLWNISKILCHHFGGGLVGGSTDRGRKKSVTTVNTLIALP